VALASAARILAQHSLRRYDLVHAVLRLCVIDIFVLNLTPSKDVQYSFFYEPALFEPGYYKFVRRFGRHATVRAFELC
jgi:hypothetical protein